MKGFFKFLFVFTSILLISAVAAPILFDFLPYKFERIFNRLVMILSLVAIVAFVRVGRQTLVRYGLAWQKESLSYYLKGFLCTLAVLTVLMTLEMIFKYVKWAPQDDLTFFSLLWKVVYLFGAGLLIGVIEEFFFRGFIYQTMRFRFKWNLYVTLILTNLFYASLHFVDKKKPYIGPDPTFFDSLTLMKAPFMSMAKFGDIWPAFVGLFIFGLMLHLLVLKSKSLYPAIGMHAGSVFFTKLDGTFLYFQNELTLSVGSAKVYDGILGWVFIILLGLLILTILPKPAPIDHD